MADTNGVIKLVDVIDRFLFKNKLPKDDYFLYLEHAIDCYRDVNLHHGTMYKQSVLTADSLGRVDMPSDLVDLIGVAVPWRGRMWWFTVDNQLVTTVTGTGDTFDEDYGEGLEVTDDVVTGYGARGGKNEYYMKVDWASRKIFITNMANSQCTVVYKSSGVVVDGTTYIPLQVQPVIDAYLRWQKSIVNNDNLGTQQLRKRDYDEAVLMLRRTQLPSANELRDMILKLFTQTISR